MKWIFILMTAVASSCGDVLCASGMAQGGELYDFSPSGIRRAIGYIVRRRRVMLGGLFYACAFFSLLGLLSTAQLSVAVPATALSFVIDTLGARFVLHERVPWKRWAGVLCVCAGVFLAVRPASLAEPSSSAAAVAQARQSPFTRQQPSPQALDQRGTNAKTIALP
jgi:drug/metabolite transporter (DMT)-like permease